MTAVSAEIEPGGWLDNGLTALRQRLCPNHFRPLLPSGWCLWCRIWYSADFIKQELVARYPFPGLGVDPET